jgi:probable Rubsico expression protein CbbX
MTSETTTPVSPSLGSGRRSGATRPLSRTSVDDRDGESHLFLEALPDSAVVDSGAIVDDAGFEEMLRELDRDLVALHEVKARIGEIAALLVVERLRRSVGLQTLAPTMHMCFTGNPGTGKTTVALLMGKLLHQLGYVRKGHLISVTREDLVGQFVGHTAPKTQEVINRAMGGVLFIDEAYHIYRVGNERDYGQETVEVLLQVMENQREDLVVIMAGYKDQMDRFFAEVPGLSSRIAHHIHFPDYELSELTEVGHLMLGQFGYRLSEEAEKAFEHYLGLRMEQPRFANGRSVRNALDRARFRQAVRLYECVRAGATLTKGDLATLDVEDISQSRVFEGGFYS